MEYKPLADINQIRLIKLVPRRSNAYIATLPGAYIVCELIDATRGVESYIALSYAWGREDNPRQISVNGSLINIHINLHEALLEFQDEEQEVVLWVDRICINQQDPIEKGHQVQQMREIYASATHVIAWLGPSADESDLIMSYFQMITTALQSGSYEAIVLGLETEKSHAAISSAFSNFCHRSYWRRLWIIQEFTVAAHVVIACGGYMVSFEELAKVMDFLEKPTSFMISHISSTDNGRQLQESFFAPGAFSSSNKRGHQIDAKNLAKLANIYKSAAPSFIEGIFTRRVRWQGWRAGAKQHGDPLMWIMCMNLVVENDYNHPECTDRRDRVFSLLGLASDAAVFHQYPDYTHSWVHIYTNVTRQFLYQGHIDILSYCQFPRNEQSERLPSWVPDWGMMTKVPCVRDLESSHFNASGMYTAKGNQIFVDIGGGENQISLQGTVVDTVAAYGDTWDPNWLKPLDPAAASIYLSQIRDFCRMSARIRLDDEELATARIAIADDLWRIDAKEESRKEILLGYRAAKIEFHEIPALGSITYPFSRSTQKYSRLMKRLHSRRAFISGSGFVGLAPWNVQCGDFICIFHAGKAAYTIRPVGNGTYNLIGETYVHGIMYGEWTRENPRLETFILT